MIRQECSVCNIPIERAEGKVLIYWPESQIFMSHPDTEIANAEIYGSAAYWVPEEVVTGEINEIQGEIFISPRSKYASPNFNFPVPLTGGNSSNHLIIFLGEEFLR